MKKGTLDTKGTEKRGKAPNNFPTTIHFPSLGRAQILSIPGFIIILAVAIVVSVIVWYLR
jgi:hypothetical protein